MSPDAPAHGIVFLIGCLIYSAQYMQAYGDGPAGVDLQNGETTNISAVMWTVDPEEGPWWTCVVYYALVHA